MKRLIPVIGVLVLLVAACQPAAQTDEALPTLAVLPSVTPTATETDTPAPTDTPPPTDTATPLPTSTTTSSPTPTSTPSPTPVFTVNPTQVAISTGTAAVEEAPRYATFTPPPPGSTPVPGTPQQMADVIVTERQFQEEVDLKTRAIQSIELAQVSFVPGGIDVELTALGGEAYITGHVLLSIEMTGSFASITIGDITVPGLENPPDEFIQVATSDFFIMMVDVLDTILNQRLGDQHNLENIVMTDSAMEITLLVPQN
ncbi:MAG: hypothetical protein H6671_11135 [Anaerolineaceae bacterium]|nr:hypothetical protein [Anaerolineaceae bacterium]